jgi:hypothetical protein
MPKITEDELIAKIEREEKSSLDYLSGSLSDERAENMELYLGDKTRELSAVEGRSSVVSMDVQEAVESMMPYLMKVFCSGDEVVKFDPVGPDDVEAAEQETDYINHVVINQNNFFLVGTQWFKDALINKNGYVKFWWDQSENVTEESYQGITDQEFQMLLADERIEPLEHTAYPDQSDPMAMQILEAAQMGDEQAMMLAQQIPMLHDVKIRISDIKGKCVIEPCPSEEILVSADERNVSPDSLRFLEHRQWKTISDLREMGYVLDDDIPDDASTLYLSEDWLSRQDFLEEEMWRDEPASGPMRRVVYREVYIKVDFDGDGIAERRMVCLVGKQILKKKGGELANYVCDGVPFAAITPYVMPHRHIGRALADYVKDIQVIKSVIQRNVLDNFYAANNGRWAISDKVNLDDMLVSRPGGVVRVEGSPGAEIFPLQTNAIGPSAFPLMEYYDSVKESRTGITRYNQGMDADSLNKTASGISQIMSAAQAKQELIARTFAETGVKDLFRGVHKLIHQHGSKTEIVRLRNKWVPIDPRQWKNRTDMTVSVGLGTGNKQEMLAHIMSILGVQQQALQIGVCTPQNIYEACIELTKNAGFKDGSKYWTSPEQMQAQQAQQQQGPSVEEQMIQAQKEIEAQKRQSDEAQKAAELELKKQQLQLDQWKTSVQEETKRMIAELNANKDIKTTSMSINAGKDVGLIELSEGGDVVPSSPLAGLIESMNQNIMMLAAGQQESINRIAEIISRPKTVVRDKSGKVQGVV